MLMPGSGRGFTMADAARHLRILIVEDDVDSWNLIQRAVQEGLPGAAVQWASDFESARLALESCRFDAVLADYMLGDGTNGWSLLSECRRLQPQARVGMTSALPLRPPRNETCPFLQKPFEIESCAEFVERLLA